MTAKSGLLLYGANGYTGRLIAEASTCGRGSARPRRPAPRGGEPVAGLAGPRVPVLPARRPGEGRGEAGAVRRASSRRGPVLADERPRTRRVSEGRGRTTSTSRARSRSSRRPFTRHEEAVKAGIAVLPGTGFDVVPSDCLAAAGAKPPGRPPLAARLPRLQDERRHDEDDDRGPPEGGRRPRRREDRPRSAGLEDETVPFPDKPRLAMTIPWGDLSTAFRSTGIENIEVYMAVPPSAVSARSGPRTSPPSSAGDSSRTSSRPASAGT